MKCVIGNMKKFSFHLAINVIKADKINYPSQCTNKLNENCIELSRNLNNSQRKFRENKTFTELNILLRHRTTVCKYYFHNECVDLMIRLLRVAL